MATGCWRSIRQAPSSIQPQRRDTTANLFLRHGLNVMMAEATPAHPAGLTFAVRLSATHAAELHGLINAALNRSGKPVWVVGTSDGSISTVTAGGFLPARAGLKGVILTSPVTN